MLPAPPGADPRAEHQSANARVHDGGGAHDARLERHVERGVVEPIAPQGLTASAQRLDFRMRGRIVARDWLICAGGDDVFTSHQHGAHRHFTRRAGAERVPSAMRMKALSRPPSAGPAM